jgi:hypothetical protein
MESILDFTRELDVGLFDQVVNTLFSGSGAQVSVARVLCATDGRA